MRKTAIRLEVESYDYAENISSILMYSRYLGQFPEARERLSDFFHIHLGVRDILGSDQEPDAILETLMKTLRSCGNFDGKHGLFGDLALFSIDLQSAFVDLEKPRVPGWEDRTPMDIIFYSETDDIEHLHRLCNIVPICKANP